MTPVLKKGLFCCLSLRTCALILGAVTLVGNVLTLSMFVVSLEQWLSHPDYHHHWNHSDASIILHPDVLAAIANATGADPTHPWASILARPDPPGGVGAGLDAHPSAQPQPAAHPGLHTEADYYDGFEDSEAMEDLYERSPHLVLALVWFDFVLVVLETLAVILLLWGAIKRRAELLLPWLGVELFTTLYDLGLFAYMFLCNSVLDPIDLMPIILLPVTVYCWLVVYSLYAEFKETASRDAAMPLSMSALEAGAAAGAPCSVPYGRMAA